VRLLVVNVYFAPFSFGGATIVAEEVVAHLRRELGCEVLVVTTIRDDTISPYAVRRFRAKGIDVVGINTPQQLAYTEDYNNPRINEIVSEIFELFRPDVFHAHCLQTMGCGYFKHMASQGVPLTVTIHDCWWICERQFMIADDGRYCFQRTIDPRRCQYCVPEHRQLRIRNDFLRRQLGMVDLLLFPSEFHRQLHVENGFPPERCIVNKNGIRFPQANYRKSQCSNGRVVFGFVGGPGLVKGSELIVKALRTIEANRYELRVVDAARTVGETWEDKHYWNIPGEIRFVPPYSQEGLDEFFSGIDVLLFPSQWKESFGLTVREALVRNVWIIATDAGGVVEDLVDGENATIIPLNGDYRPLQKAIQQCLERDDWRKYNNPYRNRIRGYGEQATELYGYFNTLLDEAAARRKKNVIHV
jgi:glycosyltransferase involved in cell wall biosynthesis